MIYVLIYSLSLFKDEFGEENGDIGSESEIVRQYKWNGKHVLTEWQNSGVPPYYIV